MGDQEAGKGPEATGQSGLEGVRTMSWRLNSALPQNANRLDVWLKQISDYISVSDGLTSPVLEVQVATRFRLTDPERCALAQREFDIDTKIWKAHMARCPQSPMLTPQLTTYVSVFSGEIELGEMACAQLRYAMIREISIIEARVTDNKAILDVVLAAVEPGSYPYEPSDEEVRRIFGDAALGHNVHAGIMDECAK